MPRPKEQQRTVFLCHECGYESSKWMGFCPSPGCGSGGPLSETTVAPTSPSPRHSWIAASTEPLQELSQLNPDDQQRISLPSDELNRVLGGGIVPGSVSLLAGEPGVGKSTLLLQIARYISATAQSVVYASGEESPHQIKLRSQRLGIPGEGIFLLSETDVEQILARLEECRPALAIVDSIQTLYTQDAPSGPGSVVQVRECGLRLLRWAKQRNVPLLIAGHMTKDGSLAGPRVLEHMVDTVMYLEGEDLNSYRILRSGKNRFGSTTEVGVFEMTGQGLIEVPDPSQALLAQRYEHAVGAALVPVLEGTRPLLLEVQALTSPSYAPAPRRVANGVDYNRLLMLTAVASRRAALDIAGQDIIVSIAGGFKVTEPAIDLGVVLAIASSLHNQPIDASSVVLGEVGLSGELRNVPQVERRLQEVSRLGLARCILPETARRDVTRSPNLELVFVSTVREAMNAILGKSRSRNQSNQPAATLIEAS
ncbi:MAG: DNA repair protein RadA [Chloroflexi bacterium]|nr:DNA repair protein RadA [Chloroflexota bacterium]MDA1219582.1 DNA repair protein RadA [Chloroflexota bacterium]PKB57549.1 MAG: DNA repair protein RadA [SAR202 cluster bacterium Casp-Chloro-G3]